MRIQALTTGFLTTAALVLGACAEPGEPDDEVGYELDVDIEIHPDANLEAYETFDIVNPRLVVEDDPPYEFTEVEDQLLIAIADELRAKGLARDADDPELLVNPMIRVGDTTDQLSFYDAAYGWYWGYAHLWTLNYEYTRGSLILDVVDQRDITDPDDDMLIYRGVARGLMAEDLEVIKLEIRNATRAIFADWPED